MSCTSVKYLTDSQLIDAKNKVCTENYIISFPKLSRSDVAYV